MNTAMMTNSISLTEQKNSLVNRINVMNSSASAMGNVRASFDFVEWLASTRPIVVLSEMVSGLMEETISPRFTLHLLNVQLSGFMAVIPAGVDIFFRIICLLWFVTSLCLAKRAYTKM